MSGDKSEPARQSGESDASNFFRAELQSNTEEKPEAEAAFDKKLLAFAGMDKKDEIKLTGEELEKLLPDFADLIKDAKFSEVAIAKKGDSHYRFELTMPAGKDVKQDIEKHGCKKLVIAPDFAFDIQKKDDGSILIDKISGVKAAKALKYDLLRVAMTKEEKEEQTDPANKEYETQITSTVSAFGGEVDRSYRDPLKVFDDFQKAFKQLHERFKEKEVSALEFPSLFRSA